LAWHGRQGISRRIKMSLQWSESFPYKAVIDVNAVDREIEKIRREKGLASAETMFEAAHARTSPLHKLCVWDKDKAFVEYNLDRMRLVARSIIHIPDDGDDNPLQGRQLVHTKDDGYVPTVEAMKRRDWRQECLEEAKEDAIAFRRKYAWLKELASIIKPIDDVFPEDPNDKVMRAK
jgi:hypothetical protein